MKPWAVLVIVMALLPVPALAQGAQLYSNRLASKDGKWLLPVASLHLTSTERDHIGRGSVQAWDITAPKGTPIYPIEDGVVEYAGCNNRGGYGCWTYIRHDSGVKTIMAHMIQGSITVKAGQRVSQWDVVGQTGFTGMTSFGPHVHLEIHKAGGGRYNISDFWNINQMHYQKLGNAASGEVATRIGVINTAGTVQPGQQPTIAGQPSATGGETFQMRVAGGLRLLNDQQRAIFLWLLILIPMWLVWVSGGIVRTIVVSSLTSLTIMVAVLWWLNPVIGQPVMAAQATVSGSATWKAAYTFMRRWEGARCVHDPVRTYKGITNGTYNAWRMSQGMGAGDVCRDLTEQQAESIYYQRYWVASGADRLSPAVAIAHFDHAVNAGVGAAKGILAQCGDNIDCYIKGRLADYRTKKNYPQYGRAWQNRVNDLVRYLQKGS